MHDPSDSSSSSVSLSSSQSPQQHASQLEERACQSLYERVVAGDILQWHREGHLERVVLVQTLRSVCTSVLGESATVVAHRQLRYTPCNTHP